MKQKGVYEPYNARYEDLIQTNATLLNVYDETSRSKVQPCFMSGIHHVYIFFLFTSPYLPINQCVHYSNIFDLRYYYLSLS